MKSVTIYGSTDDGYIYGSSTDYSVARSTSVGSQNTSESLLVGQIELIGGPGGGFTIYRSFLKFDTSVVPNNSVITGARLRMAAKEWQSTTPHTIHVVEQNWGSLNIWGSTDDRETAYDACLAGANYVNLHTFEGGLTHRPPNASLVYSEPLNTTWLDPEGYTYYSLRSHLDYENEETSSDIVIFYSAEGTLEGYRPALIVDYIELPAEPEQNRLYYFLYVDWGGDGGVDSWQDEAGRVSKFTLDRGKDRTIGSPGSGFQPPNIGRTVLTLDNFDGRYDPWNADGDLYGLIQPGRRVNFAAYYNGTFYNLMTGYLADLRPVGYKNKATMIVEDGAGWLASRPPDIPLRAVSDAGDAIKAVLDDMGYPFNRDIESGIDTLNYYWTSGASGLKEIHKLANSDMGRFSVSADGTAHFRNRHNSEEIRHTLTESLIGKDIFIPTPWDYMRSVVDVYTYPRILGSTDSTLWTLRDTPLISDGDTLTLWGEYTYENQRVPATGVYVHSYQPAADLDVAITAFSRDVKIEITNESGSAQTLTELIIKGQPIYSPDKIRVREQTVDVASQPATFVMDYEWLTNINTAVSLAKVLLAFLSDAKQYPEVWIYNRPGIALAIDLEERLRLLMDTFEVDKTYFVNKISHRSGGSMQELISTIKLYPMLQDIGEDTLILDSLTQGVLDVNKLGY